MLIFLPIEYEIHFCVPGDRHSNLRVLLDTAFALALTGLLYTDSKQGCILKLMCMPSLYYKRQLCASKLLFNDCDNNECIIRMHLKQHDYKFRYNITACLLR